MRVGVTKQGQSKIKNPKLYTEYYHNLNIFNDHLRNGMNYEIDYERYLNKSAKIPAPSEQALDKIRDRIAKVIEKNYSLDLKIREEFRQTYHRCVSQNHDNPDTLLDFSFLEFAEGNIGEAADFAERYILLGDIKSNSAKNRIDQLLVLGQSYIELAQFSKAIEVLSEALLLDPKNRDAYFHRSKAYFEIGNFDLALEDYLHSPTDSLLKPANPVSDAFREAFLNSLMAGVEDSLVDFVPSLCYSFYGLGNALWAIFPLNPESAANIDKFIFTCYEMGKCAALYAKSTNWDSLDEFTEQIKILYERFDNLGDHEKGNLIGYTIGKYGTDIFKASH